MTQTTGNDLVITCWTSWKYMLCNTKAAQSASGSRNQNLGTATKIITLASGNTNKN